MGTSMAFDISGAGYGGVSLARAIFGLNRGGHLQVYGCQLSGSAGLSNEAGSYASFEIPEPALPADLAGYTAKFKMVGGFVYRGTTELSFEVLSETQDDAVYKFNRRPRVRGYAVGDLTGVGRITRLHSVDTLEGGTFWRNTPNVTAVRSIVQQLGFLHEGGFLGFGEEMPDF